VKQPMRIPIQPRPRQQLWDDDWLDEEFEPVKTPVLRFSPTAWAKLLYFRDKSDNEVGGFGITAPDDLLFVQEFVMVEQEVSCVSVKFDDEAVSEFFDEQVDQGKKPEQFARVWLHTHPADCPHPSATDEDTFKRVFGSCQWAVMCIVAQDGSIYARLSFNVGPGGQILIPTDVDYSRDFGPSDRSAWDCQYEADVTVVNWLNQPALPQPQQGPAMTVPIVATIPAPVNDLLDEFERMDPVQRQLILDELADRPELWSGEEVIVL
jgi:proteasome lid subunit RPN8/RPN11